VNRSFAREVLKLRPRWQLAEGYFYQLPVEHLLCGFVYEKIPYSGAYLWHYAFPLYVPSDFIHLGFGDRLPHPQGFMPRDPHRQALAEAAEFICRIAPYEADTYSWGSLPGFLTLLESKRGSEYLPRTVAHALTLILLGRYGEAETPLNDVARHADRDQIPPGFVESMEEIRADLARDGEQAVECLKRWEADSKTRFGIR